MNGFTFTNEQIVYIYKHFTEYINMIDNHLLKQLKFAQGQLELAEQIYGGDPEFDKEDHRLQLQLVKEELPKVINEKKEFMYGLRNIFESAYESIADVDPTLVETIERQYINESTPIKDLLNQLKNKQNGDY